MEAPRPACSGAGRGRRRRAPSGRPGRAGAPAPCRGLGEPGRRRPRSRTARPGRPPRLGFTVGDRRPGTRPAASWRGTRTSRLRYMSRIRSAGAGSFTTMTRQPCRFPPLGANRAVSRSAPSTPSGTGSGTNRRAAPVCAAWRRGRGPRVAHRSGRWVSVGCDRGRPLSTRGTPDEAGCAICPAADRGRAHGGGPTTVELVAAVAGSGAWGSSPGVQAGGGMAETWRR